MGMFNIENRDFENFHLPGAKRNTNSSNQIVWKFEGELDWFRKLFKF